MFNSRSGIHFSQLPRVGLSITGDGDCGRKSSAVDKTQAYKRDIVNQRYAERELFKRILSGNQKQALVGGWGRKQGSDAPSALAS